MTRKQELYLIKIGLETVLDKLIQESQPKPKPQTKKQRKWSKEQHRKFADSMKKVWATKKKRITNV